MALSSLLSVLIRWLAKDEDKSFRGGYVCQEIMPLLVEHGEETLAQTEADETQQQPEKFRCVHDTGIHLNERCLHERLAFVCECVHACSYLPGKYLTFFVFHVRHLGLRDSISHWCGTSRKTKLRGLSICSKYFVLAYLAKLMSKINFCLIVHVDNCQPLSSLEFADTHIFLF